MSKKQKKSENIFFVLATIIAAAVAAFAWYKNKKAKTDEENEFSDIFEEEDLDFDDTL